MLRHFVCLHTQIHLYIYMFFYFLAILTASQAVPKSVTPTNHNHVRSSLWSSKGSEKEEIDCVPYGVKFSYRDEGRRLLLLTERGEGRCVCGGRRCFPLKRRNPNPSQFFLLSLSAVIKSKGAIRKGSPFSGLFAFVLEHWSIAPS